MSYTPLDESVGGLTTTNNHISINHQHHVPSNDEANHISSVQHHGIISSSTSSIKIVGEDNEYRKSLSEPLTQNVHVHNEAATSSSLLFSNTNNTVSLSSSSADPFYVFREDLYRQLERVDETLTDYLRIVHQTDSAVNTHELKESKKQLKRSIIQAESTLQDLQMTVSLVENDRNKFRHINDKELYDRTALITTSRNRIVRAKQEMNSEAVKAKLLQDERSKAIRRAGANVLGARTDTERENTNYIVDAQARQSLLIQHQDETLDELDMAVTRVNHMAGIMHDEIGQQNKMLTEIDEDLTNVEEELGMVMGKLAKFLKTKDTWQLGTIMCLSATCIILFFMVLYF